VLQKINNLMVIYFIYNVVGVCWCMHAGVVLLVMTWWYICWCMLVWCCWCWTWWYGVVCWCVVLLVMDLVVWCMLVGGVVGDGPGGMLVYDGALYYVNCCRDFK
jgi:hypothetical protein